MLPCTFGDKMKIASVDPGEATGLVLYDSYEKVVVGAFTDTIGNIYTRIVRFEPETVILEGQPQHSDLDPDVLHYFKVIRDDFPCVIINPGEWKPLAKARKWASYGNKHIRDAYNLLRYWKFTVGMEDIGDGLF